MVNTFNAYLAGKHGHFMQSLAEAFQFADTENLSRLGRLYPEILEAYQCDGWDEIPTRGTKNLTQEVLYVK